MPDPSSPELEVSVNISHRDLHRMQQIAEKLKAHGLKVTHLMEQSGIIAGSAPGDLLAALRSIEGVAAVESAGSVQIAPPESDSQ
jgi:hypothetical protein